MKPHWWIEVIAPIILNLSPWWRRATATINPQKTSLQYPLEDEWAPRPIWTLWSEKLSPQPEISAPAPLHRYRQTGASRIIVGTYIMVLRVTNNFTIHGCRVLCHTVLILRHIIHPCNRNDVRRVKQFLFYSTSYCITQTCTW
jgi:hypothetical protein